MAVKGSRIHPSLNLFPRLSSFPFFFHTFGPIIKKKSSVGPKVDVEERKDDPAAALMKEGKENAAAVKCPVLWPKRFKREKTNGLGLRTGWEEILMAREKNLRKKSTPSGYMSQPDRIPSTIGSLSCLAVTFTTQQINS